MSKKLSPEKLVKLTRALDSRVGEFLDGYALMGFVAGSNEPLIIVQTGDQKTQLALNTLVISSLGQIGGIAERGTENAET